MKALIVALCLALPSVAVASELPYQAKPYASHGISITPEKIFLKKDKLWVRVHVLNETGKLLTMDKTQITLRMNGAVIGREGGVFNKNPKPEYVQPGLTHPLYIEFIVGAVPAPAELDLSHGFIVDGKSLALAPYHVAP